MIKGSYALLTSVLLLSFTGGVAHADYSLTLDGRLYQLNDSVLGESTRPVQENNAKERPQTPQTERLKIESKDGALHLEQPNLPPRDKKISKPTELKPSEALRIENKSGSPTIIRPEKGDHPQDQKDIREEGKLSIVRNDIQAQTKLPLSVNSDNQLVVTKPDGSTKVLTVLPDQALAKMKEKGLITPNDSTPELTENGSGEPVYKLVEEKERKFLGIALKFRRETQVSAETGDVTTSNLETNPVKRFLSRFVFNQPKDTGDN